MKEYNEFHFGMNCRNLFRVHLKFDMLLQCNHSLVTQTSKRDSVEWLVKVHKCSRDFAIKSSLLEVED